LSTAHLVIVLHVVENEGGVVEEFDRGGKGDGLFGRDFEAGGKVKAETDADAFARALENVGSGPAEVSGGAAGIAEKLFDKDQTVVGMLPGGGAVGRHGGEWREEA
jgi:hypothetical protein